MVVSFLLMKRNGILAAGNWIVDQVKMVDVFPQRETLANILRQSERHGWDRLTIWL